jgi:hypothetical protein
LYVEKDQLEDQVLEYGLEALVSTIDDRDELIKALKAATTRCSALRKA